jgi:phage terminase large subunit-like protein
MALTSNSSRDLAQALADLVIPQAVEWAWEQIARPEQLPPPGDWFVWLIMAGRGFGKTRTGGEWLARQARVHSGHRYAVVARTTQDCREVAIEGPSGLLKALGLQIGCREYNRSTGEIRLGNGTVIYAYSAEKPDRMRGPNLNGAWCDELGTWTRKEAWTEGLVPALRIGRPRVVVTTTPRLVPLVRELATRDDGSVALTRGSTFDNAENLSPEALGELRRRYEGTRLGRQELYGELLEDVEGALWTRAMLEHRAVWEDGQEPEF